MKSGGQNILSFHRHRRGQLTSLNLCGLWKGRMYEQQPRN